MFSFNVVEVKELTLFVTNIFFSTIFFFFILKNESNKNMAATFFHSNPSQSTDDAQIVDRTIIIIREEIKMKIMSNCVPPKFFSFP